MGESQKASAGFWATVVCLSALVLYPLSIGPACWLNQRTGVGSRAILIVYRPLISIAERTGSARAIAFYASLGAKDDVRPVFLDGDVAWVRPQFWEVYRLISSTISVGNEILVNESESTETGDSDEVVE